LIIDPSVGAASAARRDFGAWRRMIARPVAGIPTTTIESAANGIVAEVRTAFPIHSYPALHMRYFAHGGVGLDPGVRASVVRTLTLLAGAAGLLLILAIANLMNLSLVQSTLRRSSTAIRLALGASRGRIARALTVESLLLGVGGAGVALLCAVAWTRWFEGTRLNERGADLSGMHVDLTVVFVTIGAAVSAAMIAFIMPARLIRTQALDRLMRRGAGALPGAHRVRSVLVGVQVTVSVVLLVTAVLLGRTVDNLRNLELGFQPEPLLTFSLDPHLHGYESATLDVMARAVASRLAAIGAVEGAGFISPAPLGSGYVTASMYATADADASPVIGAGYFVTPGLLETLGVSVLAGNRSWSADSGTAVITRAMAARLFPGLPLTMLIDRTLPTRALGRNPVRIVAIIADVKLSDVTSAAPPMILRPLAERWPGMSVMGVVNTGRRPAQLAPLVTRVVRSTAPDLPVFGVRTAREAVDLQFAERGAMARAASTLGAIGLLLAALGLYGVLSHVVAARHREIGIRAALGATPAQIMGTVTRIGLIPVACGAIVGIAGAAAASRLLAAHLYDMDRFDPASYALSIVAIIVAAAAACLVPAYRAGRLSPVEVLREE
jgi:predicted permease